MSLLYEDGCGCEEGISHFKGYLFMYFMVGRWQVNIWCDDSTLSPDTYLHLINKNKRWLVSV